MKSKNQNLGRRIAYFIWLKVLEIGGVIGAISAIAFIPYWLGKFMYARGILSLFSKNVAEFTGLRLIMEFWLGGFTLIFLIAVSIGIIWGIGTGIVYWIKYNWKKAGEFAKR